MLTIKESIDKRKNKPFIRRNKDTGEMVAGFLNTDTGVFSVDTEIKSELDIDDFLDRYELSLVLIVNNY